MHRREEVKEEKRKGQTEGGKEWCFDINLLPAGTWSVGRIPPILFHTPPKYLDG